MTSGPTPGREGSGQAAARVRARARLSAAARVRRPGLSAAVRVRRPLPWAAVGTLLVVIASGCGQKSGVAGSAEGAAGSGGASPSSAAPTVPAGDAAQPGASPGAASAGTAVPAPAPAVPAAGPAGAAAPRAAPAPAPTVAGDRTGITDTEIRIGLHAPVTGAAPLRQSTFEDGKDVYWNFVNQLPDKVLGRKVTLVFRDDEFNPVRARQVCAEMAEQEKVFLLMGGAGADQITACAQYANSKGIPYLSQGVNQAGLAGLGTYFAVSETYAQQSPQLASLIKKSGTTDIGVIVADTRSFDDAFDSFTRAAGAAGLTIRYSRRISKDANDAETLTVANELNQSGAKAVYVLASPLVFLSLARSASGQAYLPAYYGPGLTNGLNTVATLGCPGIGAAQFLSPFPQTDVIDALDRDYNAQYQAQRGRAGDDIGIALWGLNKLVKAMLDAAGKDVSRESFIATLKSGRTFTTNVYGPVQFSAGDQFGARTVHRLQADCSARVFRTVSQFATGF